MTEKFSDIREGEEVFISWLDDNQQIVSGYATFLQMSENILKFKTYNNIVVIPISRLLKIKQKIK